ncbi:MAG: gliding motility-associated ABC transporter ATP-binding subunit GldA [Bacteroidota bacterium]
MAVHVEHVTKKYGEQLALDDVSFEIKSGEIVGFIGPNGAGKSTMMKIMSGYIPPSKGTVTVHGKDVIEAPTEMQKILGYLPENNPLYLDQYVVEYLTFIAGIYQLGKNTKQKVKDIIQKTGLTKEKHKKIGSLSKGYRQRVGLAQALIHDPQVLILDEPTTGLDPNQIIEIRDLIRESGHNKTVLLSTHIMQEVEAICDRILIIHQGKIVADDTTTNIHKIMSKPTRELLVEFDKPIEPALIKKIQGIEEIVVQGENKYLIHSSGDIDIRSDIFSFAVQQELKVLTLQVQEHNLEDIFHQLTR